MKKASVKVRRISKRKLQLASVKDSPILIGDLISLHYHKERTTECESVESLLDFRRPRLFFCMALRDLIDSNMNLKHREQSKVDGMLFSERV